MNGLFTKRQTCVTSSEKEWYKEWQPMTMSHTERHQVVQQMTTNGNE